MDQRSNQRQKTHSLPFDQLLLDAAKKGSTFILWYSLHIHVPNRTLVKQKVRNSFFFSPRTASDWTTLCSSFQRLTYNFREIIRKLGPAVGSFPGLSGVTSRQKNLICSILNQSGVTSRQKNLICSILSQSVDYLGRIIWVYSEVIVPRMDFITVKTPFAR
jgi:hypothetical protein